VVDVGAGLCTVTEIPNGHYLIYDAGHWQSTQCLAAAREIVDGDVVDFLIVSHTDSDHLGEADELLAAFNVRQIIRTGMVRTSDAWANFHQALSREVLDGASVMNLQSASLIPGTTIALGDATVTLVAGWGVWTGSTGLTTAERRNVVSIVVRLDFAGSSILYTGDTVGRRITDGASACKDAEAFMVANHDAGVVSLKANVIIAPHHGADNASSECFIRAVDPDFVVFSAGHEYQHPRCNAAERYNAQGVPRTHIYRTDLGDDESADGNEEWARGRVAGCSDQRGDDDVEIVIRANGTVEVAYRGWGAGC
jgi:beta-lactamase superfamily II metal-dependent hydrolase